MVRRIICVFTLALAFASRAEAVPVHVTFTGIGSGTLGGVPFTARDFEIDIFGDSAAVFTVSGANWLPSTAAEFDIDGVGSGDFTETMYAWACTGGFCAGFSDSSLSNMVWSNRFFPQLVGYTFASNFGPLDIMELDGTAEVQPIAGSSTAGHLVFTSATETFVMTVRVPEPSTFLLFGIGGAGLLRRRWMRAA